MQFLLWWPHEIISLTIHSKFATVVNPNVNIFGDKGLPKGLRPTGWEPLLQQVPFLIAVCISWFDFIILYLCGRCIWCGDQGRMSTVFLSYSLMSHGVSGSCRHSILSWLTNLIALSTTCTHPHMLGFFTWALGMQTQVLMLAEQLYLLCHTLCVCTVCVVCKCIFVQVPV